jgi:predicted dehydrogenase
LLAELEDFADAVTQGRKPEVDGTDAFNPLAIVLGALKSSRERRSVPLSEILGEA